MLLFQKVSEQTLRIAHKTINKRFASCWKVTASNMQIANSQFISMIVDFSAL